MNTEQLGTAPMGYAALLFIFTYITQQTSVLFFIFLFLMLFDYITGLLRAFITSTLNSKVGLKGILKKFGYLFMLIVTYFVDIVVLELVNNIGIPFSYANIHGISFGTLLLIFLCGNEFVSILENLRKCGLKIPSWFINITKAIRNLPDTLLKRNDEKNKNDSVPKRLEGE